MFRTGVSRSAPWLLTPALAIGGLVGLATLGPLPALAQQAEKHQTSQQSLQRDRNYVHRLLERGTSDAKIESSLTLSTQFASFNPGGDIQAYVSNLVAEEKAKLQKTKQNQSSAIASQPVIAVSLSETASVPLNASSQAPSNSVGVESVKVAAQANGQINAQPNSQNGVQETIQTGSESESQTSSTVSSPVVDGGLLLSSVATSTSSSNQSTLANNNLTTQLIRGRTIWNWEFRNV